MESTTGKNEYTKQTLRDRISMWHTKPQLLVHKAIALVARRPEGISRSELVRRLGEATHSKDPYGVVSSMLTDTGRNYGGVFVVRDRMIYIHPDLEDQVRSLRWAVDSTAE